MFSTPWLIVRFATAVAVFGLVGSTASERGVGSALAIYFLLPPGMLVGWLGVAAAVSAASTLGYQEMERESQAMRAGIWGGEKNDIYACTRQRVARRNQQIQEERRAEQAVLVRRDVEWERIRAIRAIRHTPSPSRSRIATSCVVHDDR